ncbi:DUF1508 domain-containing protein [Lysobacter sp. K5869]|nr:DUF1508 domain-containing protein [Lysobacter sp. K5869]
MLRRKRRFDLKAGNHETIPASGCHNAEVGAHNGVGSAKKSSTLDGCCERARTQAAASGCLTSRFQTHALAGVLKAGGIYLDRPSRRARLSFGCRQAA